MIVQRLYIGTLAGDIECAGCGALAKSQPDGTMHLEHDDLCPEFPGRLADDRMSRPLVPESCPAGQKVECLRWRPGRLVPTLVHADGSECAHQPDDVASGHDKADTDRNTR
jgi:hypothetical protein